MQVTDGARMATIAVDRHGRRRPVLPAHPRPVPRPPVPRPEHGARPADHQLERAGPGRDLARPSPATTASPRSWRSSGAPWSDVSNAPENLATRQALVEQAKTVVSSIQSVYSGLSQAASDATSEYNSLTASPTGQIAQDAAELRSAQRSDQEGGGRGRPPERPARPRDQVLDDLSQHGNVSVTDLGNGSLNVGFGDAANPLVADTTVDWPRVDQQRRPAGHHRRRASSARSTTSSRPAARSPRCRAT